MSAGEFVRVTEVGPRDGLQNEAKPVPTEVKVEDVGSSDDNRNSSTKVELKGAITGFGTTACPLATCCRCASCATMSTKIATCATRIPRH